MKPIEAFFIFVFASIGFVLFAPKVTQKIETFQNQRMSELTYPGCGNRDCECYEDCSCIDGICVCGGQKPPAPPKPKPKPEPDVPPDDIGPEFDGQPFCWNPVCNCCREGKPCKCNKCDCNLEPLKASTKEIILHARANCPPCDLWWANERPKFEAAGWKIAIHSLSSTNNGRTPFFTIEVDGKQVDLQGYQTIESVSKVVW
jgi:hypothetical protein